MSKRSSSAHIAHIKDQMPEETVGGSVTVINENPSKYSHLTVAKLQEELKRRKLPFKGLKRDLISRLHIADSKSKMDVSDLRTRESKTKTASAPINGSSSTDSNSTQMKARLELQKERNSIVIWRRPFLTCYYFCLELAMLAYEFTCKLYENKKTVIASLLSTALVVWIWHMDGPHQAYVGVIRKEFLWCAYWVVLGIMSSVGLGTGLHTFLLYLGPHIAGVTLAAFECMSVDFPSPPYPDDIICPDEEGTSMSLWTIMSKVRIEAFMWGAGTAIGELPPYFVARASRLSGEKDEEEQEIEDLIAGNTQELGYYARAKIAVHDLVQKVGFMGILLCASIPNPLFDLAGITCGHFLIPFWTFFGATLIGKAVIKMHIQKLFVIFMFSEHHVEQIVSLIKKIPFFGPSLQAPFKEYLQKQKEKLHVKPGTEIKAAAQSWLSWVFEKLVMMMVAFFVVSIVNSMAQNYHKRVNEDKSKQAME